MALEDLRSEEFEALKQKAENGDVDAMVMVGNTIFSYYSDQKKAGTAATEALPWYERAAACGSVYSAYMAVQLNEILCFTAKIIGNWSEMINISDEILQYARIVLNAPEASEQVKDHTRKAVQSANYNLALGLYNSKRENEAVKFLDGTGIKKGDVQIHSVLYGLCRTDDLNEAYEWLRVLEGNGKAILPGGMDISDETIVAVAYAILSDIYRARNNCNRAREILLEGLEVIDNSDLRDILQKKLACYRKKMFGGYQYVE